MAKASERAVTARNRQKLPSAPARRWLEIGGAVPALLAPVDDLVQPVLAQAAR
jgi:hypothetical protein